jgi:pseudaminic acid cytidylyltransferase
MKSVCIIPARGGSKRIPKKNIKLFFGAPLLVHTADIAKEASIFDEIVVSTDSSEVNELCGNHSLVSSYPRPAELADDFAPVYGVMKHEIQKLELGEDDIVTCLYATAALLRPTKLMEAFKQHISSGVVSYTFAVTPFTFPPQRGLYRNEDGKIHMLEEQYFTTRSQDLKQIWHDTGTFYIGKVREWLSEPFTFNSNSVGYPLDPTEVQDIDEQHDWDLAELKYMRLKNNNDD